MKNKGFTIVELLATIVLIGIISLVALGSYSGIKKTIMNAQTNNVVSNIESTAIIYSTSRDKTGWIPLSELVENDFIDKTDLLRIDAFKDEKNDECYLLLPDETINPAVGIFIGMKYAKTNVSTEDTDGVSASANMVRSAKFYCKEANHEASADETRDIVKTNSRLDTTSGRFSSYTLYFESPDGYSKVHLSCTNGFFLSASELGVKTSQQVPDLTHSDTCTLLFYHADENNGHYMKHTYVFGGGS